MAGEKMNRRKNHSFASMEWAGVFESMPHAMGAVDSRMRLTVANGRLRRWLKKEGVTDEPVGRELKEILPAGGDSLERACRDLLGEENPEITTLSVRTGEDNEITVRLFPVPGDSEDMRLLLMFQTYSPAAGQPEFPDSADKELRRLAENISDVLFTVDSEGAIVYISPRVEQYGYSPEEVIYHRVFEYIHPDDLELVQGRFSEALSGQHESPTPFRLIRKDGGLEWMEVKAMSQYDASGGFVGMSGVLRNIGDRIELEQVRSRASRLESLELLAGGIAHDFNNLLTSILGSISLAAELNSDSEKTREILGEAEKAVTRAESLTRQLLSFARGSKTYRRLSDLGPLIEDSVSLSLMGSNIKCAPEIDESLWPVRVDEGQVGQVLSNLVINAKQAMPEGGVLAVRAANTELRSGEIPPLEAGNYVVVTVADNGEGIAAENLEKVFDPYFTTKAGGTGLGLATVYSIVRRHDGVVTVTSEPGMGTEFHIYFPAIAGDTEIAKRRALMEPVEIRGKILVMDDEEEVRSICCSLLERMGHQVAACKDGSEALEIYGREAESGQPFDLVILDLTVPSGMGGLETLEKLREIDPSVRAIVSSGYCEDPVMSDHESYGFDAVVPKPYSFAIMAEAVSRLLAGGSD